MVEEYRDQARGAKFQNQVSRNDVSWYSRNPLLLQAAGSIPFPYKPGMPVPWIKYNGDVTTENYFSSLNIPGVMALNWFPTVGWSTSATDPASVVGKEIFAKVREKFSGSIDADAPDFVIFIMALDSIYSYIAHLKRIYRILTAYTSENHYVPDGLLEALGFNVQQIIDLKEHRMQLFQVINELVFMTRKFNVPAAFDIINRHYWLGDNVYMDADSANSQFYVFNCRSFFKYSLLDTPTEGIKAGGLAFANVSYPSTKVVEYLFSYGRELIDALAGSDDAYIISGYLMRAYDNYPMFTVDELPIDDRLIPHYDVEVLMQIENALPLLGKGTVSGASVTQDPSTNAIICKPHFTSTGALVYKPTDLKLENFLSLRADTPTVADVTISTRLKMGIRNEVSTDTAWEYDIVCGSEILSSVTVRTMQSTGLMTFYTLYGLNYFKSDATGNNIVPLYLCAMSSWDWHPILPVLVENQIGQAKLNLNATLAGDVHNFTLMTNEQLYQLNRVCLYSEFNAYGQL